MRKLIWLKRTPLLVLAVGAFITCSAFSCTVEQGARNTIATNAGIVAQAQKDHQAQCSATPTASICVAINKAGLGNNVLIDALETYCGGTPSSGNAPFSQGGPCVAVKTAQDALNSAQANAQQTISDLQALLKKGGS